MPAITRTPARIPVETRDRILRAAEGLFMERGFADTSLRMITARAEVNLAAVNYHFGSKEALIREVFQRHLGPLNAARIAYLDRLEAQAQGQPLSPERIVEAIVTPVLQVSRDPVKGGARFLRLLGRALSEGTDALQGVLPEHYREVVVQVQDARWFARCPRSPRPSWSGACTSCSAPWPTRSPATTRCSSSPRARSRARTTPRW